MNAESLLKDMESVGFILSLGNPKIRLEDKGPAYEVTEGYAPE